MTAGTGLPLSAEKLRVSAGGGRLLLDLDRLELAPGAVLAVRGPSGAGKTTLLLALAGLLPATGSLRWGGTELAGASEPARTAFRGRHIGLVFQDPQLFEELGALQNAALPASFRPRAERAGIAQRAAAALERLGVPPGDRPATSYSGGERHRIAVARALATDPEILLADEPTASLDRKTADRLIDDLFAEARAATRTMIVVTHDPVLLDRAPEVLSLVDGRRMDGARPVALHA